MQNRATIHNRLRHTVSGTDVRPRLAVYRSLNNIFAQLIDDEAGKTIACASSLKMTGPLTKKAELVAKEIAGKAKELKLSALVYDRAGFRYHGAIKTVADIVRAEGVTI